MTDPDVRAGAMDEWGDDWRSESDPTPRSAPSDDWQGISLTRERVEHAFEEFPEEGPGRRAPHDPVGSTFIRQRAVFAVPPAPAVTIASTTGGVAPDRARFASGLAPSATPTPSRRLLFTIATAGVAGAMILLVARPVMRIPVRQTSSSATQAASTAGSVNFPADATVPPTAPPRGPQAERWPAGGQPPTGPTTRHAVVTPPRTAASSQQAPSATALAASSRSATSRGRSATPPAWSRDAAPAPGGAASPIAPVVRPEALARIRSEATDRAPRAALATSGPAVASRAPAPDTPPPAAAPTPTVAPPSPTAVAASPAFGAGGTVANPVSRSNSAAGPAAGASAGAAVGTPPAARTAASAGPTHMVPAPESTAVATSASTTSRDPNAGANSPAAAAPGAGAAPPDRRAIDTVLGRYQAAFTQLDAQAARSVWPAVDSRALARSFAQLESQTLSFDSCAVSVIGVRATARCAGTAIYVPKVGNRRARSEDRRWILDLRNTGDRWIITGVDTE